MSRPGIATRWRSMVITVLIGLGSMSLTAPGFGRDVVSLDEIQGIWRQVSGEFRGMPMAEKPTTFVLAGDNYTETEPNLSSSTLAIDATKFPVTYQESVNFQRPNAFTFPGILKVSGSRMLRAFSNPNGQRPSEFESKPGDQIHVETWEREGAIPPPDAPIARQIEGQWRLVTRVDNGRPYDLSRRGSRMEISGTSSVRTDTLLKSGRLILEPGSNRVVLDQSNPVAKLAGLIDFDPKEQTLKMCVNVHRQSTTPLGFVTGPDNLNMLRVFKKDDGAKDSRPR